MNELAAGQGHRLRDAVVRRDVEERRRHQRGELRRLAGGRRLGLGPTRLGDRRRLAHVGEGEAEDVVRTATMGELGALGQAGGACGVHQAGHVIQYLVGDLYQ